MNQELFDSMRTQMTPSPAVRAALSEKLARPAKKRPVPWIKYGALAACAALVIGGLSVYNYCQDPANWKIIVRSFHPDVIINTPGPLHSYVTVEDAADYATENAAANDTGTGGTEVNTGDLPSRDDAPSGALPGGAYIGDVPVQKGAEDYQKLMDRFNGTYPDWYGGAYLDSSGRLVVQLVEDKDPADKSLELQVLDWTDNGRVAFTDVKYSLAHLDKLMDQLNHLPETDPQCGDVMASWYRDEMNNRVVVTLTEVNDHILSVLAELDPDDDAIYVQVGQRASLDSASTEDPAVHHVVPGGATVPDNEDLIADEPYYYEGVRDGAHYDVLPEELPEQKQPAFVETGSVPEEDTSAFTPAYDPDVGFTSPKE